MDTTFFPYGVDPYCRALKDGQAMSIYRPYCIIFRTLDCIISRKGTEFIVFSPATNETYKLKKVGDTNSHGLITSIRKKSDKDIYIWDEFRRNNLVIETRILDEIKND